MASQNPSAAAPPDLMAVRREIDAIDDQLHALLLRRAALVTGVQAAKADRTGLFLRPGREVQIIRRLAASHGGSLPLAALSAIWRELIGGLYHLQGGIRVAVHTAPDPVALWDIARGHFGVAATLTRHEDWQAVLASISGQAGAVGLLAAGDGGANPWWVHLVSEAPGTPRVIARLPLVDAGTGPAAFLVAPVLPEPSGDDNSLLVVTLNTERMSRQRVLELLVAAEFQPHLLATADSALLVEVAGFVAAADPRLAAFAATAVEAGATALPIGAFAVPLSTAQPE